MYGVVFTWEWVLKRYWFCILLCHMIGLKKLLSLFQGSKLTLTNSQNASEKNIRYSKRLRVRIICLPNIWKEFASGLTSLLVEKNLTSQTLQVDWKVNFEPCFASNQK